MKRRFPIAVIVCLVAAGVVGLVFYHFLHLHGRDTVNTDHPEITESPILSTSDAPKPDHITRTNPIESENAALLRVAPKSDEDARRLLSILKDRARTAAERAGAADELGKLRAKVAFETFIQIVQDGSEPISLKYKSARGLGVLGDERAVSVLSAILTNQNADNHLRIVSALALGNLGSEACVATLQRAGGDPDSMIRFKVVEGLGRTHKKSALEFVERATADPDPHVQARAIHSLGELGDKSIIGNIREILQATQSDFIRIACLTALGSIQEPESIFLLREYENETNQLIRLNAQAALQRLHQEARRQ